jgi:hypothetical protein
MSLPSLGFWPAPPQAQSSQPTFLLLLPAGPRALSSWAGPAAAEAAVQRGHAPARPPWLANALAPPLLMLTRGAHSNSVTPNLPPSSARKADAAEPNSPTPASDFPGRGGYPHVHATLNPPQQPRPQPPDKNGRIPSLSRR